jgi:hypothetical protein
MEIEPPTPRCRGESRGSSPAPHSPVSAILSSFFILVHGVVCRLAVLYIN